jgi:hypothetical protein
MSVGVCLCVHVGGGGVQTNKEIYCDSYPEK